MEIQLEDETSAFRMSEIFSCGRYAMGESFAYRFYHNLVEILRGERLIYRDNADMSLTASILPVLECMRGIPTF